MTAAHSIAPHTSRRTFAIISHPDAGKTTLTERLLLAGGAIRAAGDVKARGERRRARSDWMEIEQKRGISVTSSVMTFEKDGITFNLLDTPGHSDFSEDTYRTLTAVDAAVMVIDAARGIETQTRKLFEVCRLRDIPIVTFINKVDREGVDPLTLLDDISSGLALDLAPMTWPIGLGPDFRAIVDIAGKRAIMPNERGGHAAKTVTFSDPAELEQLGVEPHILGPALEGLELAAGALPQFDLTAFREGHLSPVYFGSALKEFGVAELLQALADFAPPPAARPATTREVTADEKPVTGFVFKVQANMDPNHRDRVAFVRLCSGRFRRGMKMFHVRENRMVTISAPILFFAQERETADEALPGDIIGIPNHGILRVGDTLTEGEAIRFEGIPNFAPEILRRVHLDDPMKAKQLGRALQDMAEEGVTQVFRPMVGVHAIVGVVGPLQLDVLASRMDKEYGVPIRYEPAPYVTARWITSTDRSQIDKFLDLNRSSVAEDRDGALVFLARNAWTLDQVRQDWPGLAFADTRERG